MVSTVENYGNGNIYQTIGRLDPDKRGTVGTSTSSKRLEAIRSIEISAEPSAYTVAQQKDATDTEFGLTHKNTSAKRLEAIRSMQARIVENHGYAAKQATINKLAYNTKIINIPPDQRGTIADLSA